ncbi:conserved hypothetical protein [Ricinus communis]|uniref:RNase H type-1 domain-containing protein n=1 Tax=Ricinus communis TaxID=3988 RepID=B9RRI1_RICCO|nr:conserved hypothetical protein [Ricinus communis]
MFNQNLLFPPITNHVSGSLALSLGWVKFNSDVAKMEGNKYVGSIGRNASCNFIDGLTKTIHCSLVLQEEAVALREAVNLAISTGVSKVVSEFDAADLLDMATRRNISWEVEAIISDILHI